MKYQITVPNVDDFDIVEISEILVAVGDVVKTDDSVVTLESEKAAMEIPSPKSGTVREIHAQVGDKVQTGAPLISLEIEPDAGERTDEESAVSVQPQTASQNRVADKQEISDKQQAPKSAPEGDKIALRASPSVRRFARELGVKLSAVTGSGSKGRITRADVAQFFRTLASSRAQAETVRRVDYRRFGKTRIENINRIQRASAKHLQSTWQTIPHVCQHGEADISKLEDYRKQLNADGKHTSKLTLLPFLIKAIALSLKAHPNFNASIESEGTLLIREYYHIGFAVDTKNGLLVPVIQDADLKTIADIADEAAQLAQQARANKLSASEMSGGCITISNLGGLDSGAFTPIINAPEAAILGISRTRTTPVWDGKQFIPKPMLPLHLSYDHRLNNGVATVHFLNHYCDLLSNIDIFKNA